MEFLFRRVKQDDYTDHMPRNPGLVLTKHCAIKGLQLGAVVGFVSVPFISFFRKRPLSKAYLRCMTYGPIGGTFLSLGMMASKNLNPGEVDDRAYRIQKNPGQATVDRYSTLGATVGIASSAVIFSSKYMFPLTTTGILFGVAAFVIEKKKLIQLAQEKIREFQTPTSTSSSPRLTGDYSSSSTTMEAPSADSSSNTTSNNDNNNLDNINTSTDCSENKDTETKSE